MGFCFSKKDYEEIVESPKKATYVISIKVSTQRIKFN